VCVSIGHHDPATLLQQAIAEAELGEKLFEFCFEFLSDPGTGPSAVREFVQRHPDAWVIATCRRGQLNFHGGIEEQLSLLRASVDSGARCVDLEIETAEHAHAWLRNLSGRCARIVSYHNYEDCPSLPPIVGKLEATGADMIKIAVTTRTAASLRRLMTAAIKLRTSEPDAGHGRGRPGQPACSPRFSDVRSPTFLQRARKRQRRGSHRPALCARLTASKNWATRRRSSRHRTACLPRNL